MALILLVLLRYSSGGKIVEYRPSYDYGQVFHDFSEQTLSAVNGGTSLDAIDDTVYTDRGAYFNGGSDQIKLPPNNNATSSFAIPSTFSVIVWYMSVGSDGVIFHRYGSATNYFYIMRKDGNKSLQLHFLTATIDTTLLVSTTNTFLKSNT